MSFTSDGMGVRRFRSIIWIGVCHGIVAAPMGLGINVANTYFCTYLNWVGRVSHRLESWGKLGLSTSPIEYRFKTAIQRLAPWLSWAPAAQRPIILIGTAHNGNESRQFHCVMKRSRPQVVISTTPSGIIGNIDLPGWAHRYWIDSDV